MIPGRRSVRFSRAGGERLGAAGAGQQQVRAAARARPVQRGARLRGKPAGCRLSHGGDDDEEAGRWHRQR